MPKKKSANNFTVTVRWSVTLAPAVFELLVRRAISAGFELTKYPDANATVAEYLRYYGENQIAKVKREYDL